ncbi:MAG: bifunctional phosphoribosylaminoimidazolecarboxamide formyltransferase/inosine monophosphate cyclohydrolase [Coriobacteriales bacterium]|jgi:phosphoribosylaminoimidazolecarboxamide formyltransferase/IMP cyclohydrolase|nr:bifunctional phosphoribosylaminoimidazolecarboxamide formyltransferase/inosine monophosphate cyclohydrolase [Coriobacteriales bacterium]
MESPRIKRVLISVTDKTGVVSFAHVLTQEFGAEVISTGGTARALEEAGIAVRRIDDLTGFPEMMDGRVKTLHPRVHGGLLARRDVLAHMEAAAKHGIDMIDMVVVNLYAFEATVARKDVSFEEAIENIDIGGPSMLRSAAKNHQAVAVVTNPSSYEEILGEMRAHDGATTLNTRRRLALEVFRLTSAYDNAIYSWFARQVSDENAFPDECRLFLTKQSDLRYGENPHQRAAFYRRAQDSGAAQGAASGQGTASPQDGTTPAQDGIVSGQGPHPEYQLANAGQIQGKELSYNNYLDLDAAWGAVREFEAPTCVIVKHLTPCGIASNNSLVDAYQRAHEVDPVSAFGGVMAFNRPVPAALVKAIYANGQFVEAVIAPAYEDAALTLFEEKENLRVLKTGGINVFGDSVDYRSVEGGMLVMTTDTVSEDPATFTVPTKREPTPEELESLLFAWRACKSVKSNAIVIAKDNATVGSGAGQPNRVNSARIAVSQAGEKARGAVAASDAFMPFADSLEVLIDAGVTAVIQPGGSIRDEEVIAAADAAGLALVFTGHRHFRH